MLLMLLVVLDGIATDYMFQNENRLWQEIFKISSNLDMELDAV